MFPDETATGKKKQDLHILTFSKKEDPDKSKFQKKNTLST